MEELKCKLQLESNRREIFERKNAELEIVNDNLRSDNDRLLAEVDALRKRLTLLEAAEADQSDSSSEEDESQDLSNGTHHNSDSSSLSTNGNHSNSNNTSEGKGGGRDEKILTLKRKQKVLKAELEESLFKTTGFQEAFQNEMDLRTKLEEKYENLYLRYERLVLENDHFRTVLSNHCIDVPPHQPITKRRPRNSSNPPSSSLRPPSFVPPGRQRQAIGSTGSGSGSGRGSRTSSRAGQNSSPSHSISSHSSADPDSTTPPAGNSAFELSTSSIGKTSLEDLDRTNGSTPLNGNVHAGRPHPLSMLTSSSTMTDSESEEEGERVEHIVLEPAPTTPSITQDIDEALVTTADQIANAKAFYQHIRQRMEEEAELSDN